MALMLDFTYLFKKAMAQKDLDDFLKFMEERAEGGKQSINQALYDKLYELVAVVNATDMSDFDKIHAAMLEIQELNTTSSLKDITEIYLYELQFSTVREHLKNSFLHLMVTFFAEAGEEDWNYLQGIILEDHGFRGESALRYLLSIGLLHPEFTDRVLDFIDNRLSALSENQQNISVALLQEDFPDNKHAERIIKKSGIKQWEVRYGTEGQNQSGKASAAQTGAPVAGRENKPWWKFW